MLNISEHFEYYHNTLSHSERFKLVSKWEDYVFSETKWDSIYFKGNDDSLCVSILLNDSDENNSNLTRSALYKKLLKIQKSSILY